MTHTPGDADVRIADLALSDALAAIVGRAHVSDEPAAMEVYLHEPRRLFHGHARAVVRPKTCEEVAAIVRLCCAERIPVVPQGGNTGLVGGQTPLGDGRAVVLSLTRMNAVREIDPVSNTLTVEAGATLDAARAAAESVDREFPLWFASAGSCTIGGNLSTNAGGVNVLAFGNTRDLVNGIEVVMSGGRVLSGLSKLKKDNTGYDLKHLFIGAEGTLGVVTAAVLKMFPRPRSIETAFIAVNSPAAALTLFQQARTIFAGSLRSFELMPRIAIEFVLGSVPQTRDPFKDPYPWYVLVEVGTSQSRSLRDELLEFLTEASDGGLLCTAAIAQSIGQAEAFWALRENISEAQRHYGGSIKHDVSIPIASIPAFLDRVASELAAAVSGARLCAFGHCGDGNIHCNVQQPVGADQAAFLARWSEVNSLVHGIVHQFNGSISAEHGIGQLKRDLLPGVKDPVALETMRAIKASLDPLGIFNPGKVL